MDGSDMGLLAYGWRVALVFVILFGGLYALRRWAGALSVSRSPHGHMRIVETLSVGPQRQLHIVQVEGRRFLIGATPQSFTFLTELDANSTRAPKEEPSH